MPIPYSGQVMRFENPDGSDVRLRVFGNQLHGVLETLDGYTVTRDPASGFFSYARLAADELGFESIGVPVGSIDPATLDLPPRVRVPREAARAMAARRAQLAPPARWQVRRAKRRHAALQAFAGDGPSAAPPPAGTVGKYVGLCILVRFPDVPAVIPRDEVYRFCNKVDYRGFGNNGSVRDYFASVSGGKLTYTNIVTRYYTAKRERSYYTDPTAPYGSRAQELIREALDDLVARDYDVRRLTVDSAGYVHALNVFYAGRVMNNWGEGLWPHSGWIGSPYRIGRKTFFDYQFTNMDSELSLGVFCHENGHMICDFPDLYDYQGESRGSGDFCLMSGYGSLKNPVHVGAYLKHAAGWADSVTELEPGTTVSLEAGRNDFALHRRNEREYFIIENRRQRGHDALVPDSGLAIWHVDAWGNNSNEQMTGALHYECSLEQADGAFDLERGWNGGDSSDLFGSPGATRFGAATTPNSRWWNGRDSGLEITSVSAPGRRMTFRVGKRSPARSGLDPGSALLLGD